MRKLLLLFMVMLCLCSCDDTASDGVVASVEQCDQYDYTFKVYVNRLKCLVQIDGGQGYWLFTNDTLQIGDTIHIGKICKEH